MPTVFFSRVAFVELLVYNKRYEKINANDKRYF